MKSEITDEDVYRASFKKADAELATLRTQLKSVEAERDEAKRLLVETLKFSHFGMPGVFPKPDWFARRDTFLNPKPQDVK